MKKMLSIKIVMLMVALFVGGTVQGNSSYPRSIFVPRQLSYNPILENALVLDAKTHGEFDCFFSAKPVYTQSVGSKFQEYFTINHKCSLNVQENGLGDISSLWFNVISSDDTFYNSTLTFRPKRQTFGGLLYFAVQMGCDFQVAVNTALVTAKQGMHICEQGVRNLGTCDGYATVTESFANSERLFGKICGVHEKTGLDDIQIKLIYNFRQNECLYWDVYGLVGLPTGKGSKAEFLFEPLVGSNHAQFGFGTDMEWQIAENHCGAWSLLAEAKYRYAIRAQECRSFDLKDNGEWSRYMLVVNETDKFAFYPAINNLTFKTQVSPQSSFDLYIATHFNQNAWSFELGYDLWYRSAEKVSVCPQHLSSFGIADLKGIALQNPQSASTVNISQGVQPGVNQMTSNATFVPVKFTDLNCISGAQASSFSNSVYGSMAYKFDTKCHTVQLGLSAAYEHGSSVNTPDNVTTWLNIDLNF